MQRFQTLKGDLKDVGVGKLGGVVDHIDPEEGDDRHVCDGVGIAAVFFKVVWQSINQNGDGCCRGCCCSVVLL